MKKKKIGKIKLALTNALELPWEVMTNATRMVLLNNTDLFLENHKGIKEYTLQYIRIQTDNYQFAVKGKDLELKKMGTENIIIKGEIQAIEFLP